jgi:hypothetical protein
LDEPEQQRLHTYPRSFNSQRSRMKPRSLESGQTRPGIPCSTREDSSLAHAFQISHLASRHRASDVRIARLTPLKLLMPCPISPIGTRPFTSVVEEAVNRPMPASASRTSGRAFVRQRARHRNHF